jgi:receptor protein-tyrosine kinase
VKDDAMSKATPILTVAQKSVGRSLGAILIDSGKLSVADADRVIKLQKEKSIRFGEAALLLGLVSQEDIDRALARQYDYPYLLKGQGAISEELIAAYEPRSRQVEVLRALRSQLILRWFESEPKQIGLAVTSCSNGDGRSYIAANLAVVFSQLGERTLLIDADMRNPRQHALFGIDNSRGLSTVLSERAGLEVVRRIPDFVDLSVLAAGPQPPNPQELLGKPAFPKILQYVSPTYDVVIVDTPAASLYADAQVILSKIKGTLLIARRHHTQLETLSKLAGEVNQTGSQVVGTVLNEY